MSKMKLNNILWILLLSCSGVRSDNILIAFPVASKSLHHLMSTLGLALAEAGHTVTHLSSFNPHVAHPNITHLQPDDFNVDLKLDKDMFQGGSQIDFLDWVTKLFTKIPHKFWKNQEIWKLYHQRQEFDAIISTSYANEAFLPFIVGYKGVYVVVCTPGIEYNCLSYSGNWATPAIVSNYILPYDEFMTFTERIHNSVTMVVEKMFEVFVLVPTYMKAIRTYFPEFHDMRDTYGRVDLTLINGHFALDSPVPLLPNQVEIGTINAKKPQPLPKDLQKVFNETGVEGVIYFSLGSFIRGREIPLKMKNMLVEAFRQLPHTVIWKYEDDDLDLPPNVITRKWLPQQDILGHPKTRVFMSHCGNLGSQEAKYHGVPVLAVPITFDQPRNAARLERKGYGVVLNWSDMTVERILEAVHKLTNDSTYSDRLKTVSRVLQDQKESPAERAVWWIEYVLRHKGAPHMRYAGKRLHFLQYILVDVILLWSALLIFSLFLTVKICKMLWRACCGNKKLKSE